VQIEFTPEEIIIMRDILEIVLKTVGRDAVPAFLTFDTRFAKAQEADA